MRSSRYVMALCAMVTLAIFGVGCDKTQNIYASPTAPNTVLVGTCGDKLDNNGNHLVDSDDPICHNDGNAGNPRSYEPTWNEGSGPSNAPTISAPGAFTLNDGVCQGSIAKLNWTSSAGAEYIQVWRQLFTSGTLVLVQDRIAANITTLDLQAVVNATNYWKIVAVNGAGSTSSTLAAGIRTDVPGMVYVCGAPPPPVVTAPPGGTTPPGGTPPGGTTPPSGGGNMIRITGPASLPSGSAQGTAECSTNGGATWGGCPNPWWWSDHNSNVFVTPNGSMQRLSSGGARVCVQWSQYQTSPSDCKDY